MVESVAIGMMILDRRRRAGTVTLAVGCMAGHTLSSPEDAMGSETNTTHIGSVTGTVHTGSGDINVQATVSIDVLVQKLETAMVAAGVPTEKKKSVMRAVGEVIREIGTDLAAKVIVEFGKG
jgi:hypothetical protein